MMNLLSAIGSTPLVELNNLNGNSKVRIFGKLEGQKNITRTSNLGQIINE